MAITKSRSKPKSKQVEMSRVKQMVKSIISQPVEHKYFDQSLQFGAVVAGNIYCISDITRVIKSHNVLVIKLPYDYWIFAHHLALTLMWIKL